MIKKNMENSIKRQRAKSLFHVNYPIINIQITDQSLAVQLFLFV